MTSSSSQNYRAILKELDISETAYKAAERRYADLGDFFSSESAHCAQYDPHIYAQGSFRLGTVVRPLGRDDEFDLDVGCRLRSGISKKLHTQEQLKVLTRDDLDRYREQRQVQKPLEEKRRCWRLKYKDELKFHLDVVPSIPEDLQRRRLLTEAVASGGVDHVLASEVAEHAGAITDNKHPAYQVISHDWRVSNSEGYALWFQSRVLRARELVEARAILAKATVDKLPPYGWRSPLQDAVKLLKRHRDIMFRTNDDAKPISAIITTLAAKAYDGETDVDAALTSILAKMGTLVRPIHPRVPNPVNPAEDFADKWPEPEYAHLKLEQNFWAWLLAAQKDFARLRGSSKNLLQEEARKLFDVSPVFGSSEATSLAGLATSGPTIITNTTSRPWSR